MKTFNEHLKQMAELNKIKYFLKENNISEKEFVVKVLEDALFHENNEEKAKEIQLLLSNCEINEGVGNWLGSMLPGRWGAGFEQSNQADKMLSALQQYAKAGLPADDRRVVDLYKKMGISDPSKSPSEQEIINNKAMQQEFRNKAYGAGYGDFMAGQSSGSLASAPQTPSGLGRINLTQPQVQQPNIQQPQQQSQFSQLINHPSFTKAISDAVSRIMGTHQPAAVQQPAAQQPAPIDWSKIST